MYCWLSFYWRLLNMNRTTMIDCFVILACAALVIYFIHIKAVCCYVPSLAALGQGVHWLFPKRLRNKTYQLRSQI